MATYTSRGLPVQRLPAWLKPSDIALNISANTSAFSSPFTRSAQTVELPGAMHMLEAGFPPIYDAERVNELRAFSARLRGQAGRFLFPAYACRYAPPLAGLPERVTMLPLTADNTYITADNNVISADATQVQMETTFTVSSCPDSVTIVGVLWFNSQRHPMRVGGYIAWDDATGWRHLHTIVDIALDGETSVAALTVEPPMRSRPGPATPMHVHAPAGIFQLTDAAAANLRQSGRAVSFSLSAVQSFPLVVSA